MPPRTRRETPARQDARLRKHIAQAKDYWAKAPLELEQGDICQASEKGWGTVAQLTKAVATLRGWDHYDHVAIREAIVALAGELPELPTDLVYGLSLAESLHSNFYEVFMTPQYAAATLNGLPPLLEILWAQLPAAYTGDQSFAQWVERE